MPSGIEHVKLWLINNIYEFEGYGCEYQEGGLGRCDAVRPETGLPAMWSNIAPPSTGLNLKAVSFPKGQVRFWQRLGRGFRSSGEAGGDTLSQRATVIFPTLLAIFCQAARRHMHRTSFPSNCNSLEHFVWPSSSSDYQDCQSVLAYEIFTHYEQQ